MESFAEFLVACAPLQFYWAWAMLLPSRDLFDVLVEGSCLDLFVDRLAVLFFINGWSKESSCLLVTQKYLKQIVFLFPLLHNAADGLFFWKISWCGLGGCFEIAGFDLRYAGVSNVPVTRTSRNSRLLSCSVSILFWKMGNNYSDSMK